MVPPACAVVFRRTPTLRRFVISLWFATFFPGIAGATVHLVCTPGNIEFGKVAVGQEKTVPAILANTGSTEIKVSSLQVGNNAFAVSGLSFPLIVKANQRISFDVAFSPTTGRFEPGDLLFRISSSASLTISVSGQGVNNWSLSASPSSLAFGSVPLGSSSKLGVTLTNQGTSTITISEESRLAGEFTLSGPALPIILAEGEGATFQVTFTPKWRVAAAGDFWVSNVNDPVFAVPLSGSGGGTNATQLTVAPTHLNFGSVTVGNTGTQAGTITAKGGSVTISAASLASSLFSLNGIALPLTLSAGQSASFNVVFTPQAGGTATSTLSFVSSAGDSPTAESLSGSGVESAFTVNLSWDRSTSQVSGYNVYRSSSLSGNYSRLNAALDASTAFTDSTVASGLTYYYDVTSVNSSGAESSPCTPVKVTVN
ncbi:MAG TPA: choice-of-anchor D domain-containing protein [Candidatus Sulfotelmatobacter sp.]